MEAPNLPVSALLREAAGFGDELDDKRRSKDEYRKQRDLEEQRKAGTAPAMVDIETGRDINPHIPEFIEKTPWYVPTSGPTLKHQRPHPERQKEFTNIREWYQKGTTQNVAKKFRPGACENCGAMGHKKRDCFERPRVKGARFTESEIAPDDFVASQLNLGYAAKRDRWNGYDSADYRQVIEEHEKMEETRKMIKTKKIEEGEAAPENPDEDEDKYADDMIPEQSVDMDSRTRITVRNLRIREDTAKYLYNLDPNGPYYDPKSRSMRENPFANMPGKETEAAKFSGENFVRYSGEVVDANEAQVFAWQARCKGIDVHSLAEPTKLEALKREFEKQKVDVKDETKKKLLEKYGGDEHLNAPPKELLLAQTENYVEYNRKGKVIKGQERAAVKSRYEEEIFPLNHTSVFGSWWKDGRWGFKCCHSLTKNSYCIGEKGHSLEAELPAGTFEMRLPQMMIDASTRREGGEIERTLPAPSTFAKPTAADLATDGKTKKSTETSSPETSDDEADKSKKSKQGVESTSSSSSSEDEEEKKRRQLKRAVRKAKREKLEGMTRKSADDRKRAYNSMHEVAKPSETDREAYDLVRTYAADPMAAELDEKMLQKKKRKEK